MLPEHQVAFKYKGMGPDRIVLTVLVEPGVTKQQLEELTEHLREESNAAEIEYTDFPELLVTGHSLGYWTSYSGSHLRDKDWSKRPEQQDVDMWSKYMQAQISGEDVALNKPLPPDNAEAKFRSLAERHEVGVDEVKRRVRKVSSWIASSE